MLSRSGREFAKPADPVPKKRKNESSPASVSSKPVTRRDTDFWLIGQPSPSITGSKLPDCRQVMKYFLFLRHDPENIKNKISNDEIAYAAVDSVITFWNMARIKTKYRHNCMQDVMNLWGQWDAVAKNKVRPTDPGEKRANFMNKLNTLFDIGAPDAMDEIMKNRLLSAEKKNDDVQFYIDQMGARKATMNVHNKVFETKAKFKIACMRRSQSLSQIQGQREEEVRYTLEAEARGDTEASESSDDVDESSLEPDFDSDFEGCSKSKQKDFVKVLLPRKIMQCEAITTAADRLKLSDNQTTMIIAAVLKAGGSDLQDFDISCSTSRRSRIANRHKIAETTINEVRQTPPRFGALHWDGKLVSDMLGVARDSWPSRGSESRAPCSS